MSPPTVGIIGFVVVLLFMSIGMPIGMSFLFVGFVGITYLSGLDVALSALARVPYTWSTEYVFTCIPLFVMMGFVCFTSGIAGGFYRAAHKFLVRVPGGLALASILGCGGFAAVSGSSTASAATMGSICIPEMRRYKYDDGLATGVIAAGGTIGIMIPPSLGFIIFGILAEVSIGKLFIAGIIPGIMQVSIFMVIVYILVKLKPSLAPMSNETYTWKQKFAGLKEIWPIMLIFIFILGGIYTGAFTPVEAGGMGAVLTTIVAFGLRQMNLKKFVAACKSSIGITAMMFMLLMGAMVFNVFLAITQLPQSLTTLMASAGLSPTALVIAILIFYIPLGCFMDATAIAILTIPLYLPALTAAGVDLIWFGVLSVMIFEIALLTPPVGMNVFVTQGVVKDVPLYTIFRGVTPFVIGHAILVVVVFLVPWFATFLPSLMG